MSIKNVKAYMERLKTDKAFRDRLNAAGDEESRNAILRAEGYDFTEEDISAVTGELSIEDLEKVAGGIPVNFT